MEFKKPFPAPHLPVVSRLLGLHAFTDAIIAQQCISMSCVALWQGFVVIIYSNCVAIRLRTPSAAHKTDFSYYSYVTSVCRSKFGILPKRGFQINSERWIKR